MNNRLTDHLYDLVASLHDLRRRIRQTAHLEVAHAVGEALQELTRTLICGPVRMPPHRSAGHGAWDDPWADPFQDPWAVPAQPRAEAEAADGALPSLATLPPALLAGLAAARWTYRRTRQVGPALLVALLVALAAHTGGPTVQALLDAWATANELLDPPSSRRDVA